jgi:hypothetical protein
MTRWGSTATVTLAQSQKSTFSLAYWVIITGLLY